MNTTVNIYEIMIIEGIIFTLQENIPEPFNNKVQWQKPSLDEREVWLNNQTEIMKVVSKNNSKEERMQKKLYVLR